MNVLMFPVEYKLQTRKRIGRYALKVSFYSYIKCGIFLYILCIFALIENKNTDDKVKDFHVVEIKNVDNRTMNLLWVSCE